MPIVGFRTSEASEPLAMRAAAHSGPDTRNETWPPLPYADWKPTCDTLHMCTQIVGKVKLGLTPLLNDWWNITFAVTSRGLTTSIIPFGDRAFQVDFDFIDHDIHLTTSDGTSRNMQLRARPVADFYREFMAQLGASGINVEINTRPVEVDNPIPFERDYTHATYDPHLVSRWWRILLATSKIMERFRSPFVGKSSPVQFFWGSFDLATSRYSGRPAPRRHWPAHWMAIAAEYEYSLAGFWSGDERMPEPTFVAYTYPEPPALRRASIRPEAAYFHPRLGEFVLPYEKVRMAPNPEQLIVDFYLSAYEAGATLAGWDRSALERHGVKLAA